MSPIMLLPALAPPPPSGLLGVVYQDTSGGLSITHLDTVSTSWTGVAATMWSGLDKGPNYMANTINTTLNGPFCGSTTYSDLEYCSTTDEFYWPGVATTTIERVSRATGAPVATIGGLPATAHSIAYDAGNDEFHVSIRSGTPRGRVSSFISRANFDTATWPITGPTVYWETFGGLNGQEQNALAWDAVGSGAVNGPHPGSLYHAACGFGGIAYFTDWAGDGTAASFATGSAIRSLAIDNLSGSLNVYQLDPSGGVSVVVRRYGINGGPPNATATMTSAQLPNYNNSGFVYLYEYT